MRRIVGLALSLLALSAIAAETTPTLEERMSKGEFHAAGLDKLSPAELKSLNDWLSGHAIVKTITKIETPTGKPVFETDQGQRQVIETRITGRFTG